MVRTWIALGLVSMLCLAGCGDAGPAESAETDEVVEDDAEMPWWPSGNDSSRDDGSAWPKWKNPCPGPACDPPRRRGEEVSNPPPDEVEAPTFDPAPMAPEGG